MVATWEFLDHQGNPQRPKRPVPVILRELQQLAPFFYLSAVRDAAREFQPRSGFWGSFLRNPAIPDAVRAQLEADLATVNEKVIDTDARLKEAVLRKPVDREHC
jgi:putative ATP-dependent endonuclease of OLD family